MRNLICLIFAFLNLYNITYAQPEPTSIPGLNVKISNAELGKFPYIKTFPNFAPTNYSDSITVEQNQVYMYDGKKMHTIAGKVSWQILHMKNGNLPKPSEFQIQNEITKIVSTLGGQKIYEGIVPNNIYTDELKKDIVDLASKKQIVGSSYYGMTEYVIKTKEKEIWIQLVSATIDSYFYSLLVLEKENKLLSTNTNKENLILKKLEKNTKTSIQMAFETDSEILMSESKDELLNIVNVYQAHKDWKLKIEIHTAPIGKPEYALLLTEKRAQAIKKELIGLGVSTNQLDISGKGDSKPIIANENEKARITNTRVEIIKI